MTVRPAPARRPSERPRISLVFAVHDPEYGGDLLGRTQRHLDALIDFANRYQLPAEIIIVEWNPRQDRARFRELLRWPDALGYACLRFIEVPPEIHRTLPDADQLPIFEYIAKNAGLRRARGEFLLATNPDLFYSPALMRWLARASLSPEKFYRVDRRDLSAEIPSGLSLARQLRFCSQHVAHVHALFGSYRPGDPDIARRLKEEYDRCFGDPTSAKRWINTPDARLILPADGLHRNAAGDFFLMERGCWHRLRGYPELYTHAHIDAILCWVAASAGLVQEILPPHCHLYHQAHHRESRGGFPQTDWKPWYARYQEAVRQDSPGKSASMVVNGPDWGLAHEVLPEWQADPRLVQVQVPSDNTALRAALRDEQSRREAERAAAETMLREARRAHQAERVAMKAALHEAQAAQQSEAARRRALESSTAWRMTWPFRRVLSSFPGLRRTPQRPPRLPDAEHGASKSRTDAVGNPKHDRPHKDSHSPAPAREAGSDDPPVDLSTRKTTPDAVPTLPRLLSKRFREVEPLRAFTVPGDAPRVSLVTDSISANSLFGGGASAIVVSALLARYLGARLRLITVTEPPEPHNVAGVLTTHGVPSPGDIEFVYVGPGRREEVPVGDRELFVTTSWRSTRCVLPIVDPRRLVYLVQEDERMLYPWGDDRLRCVETLSDPNIRFVINSRRLFDHLTQGPEALPNIDANGAWFDPAFPVRDDTIADVDPLGGTRHFFFYTRPDAGSLYWRGLEAIGAALEENVLDPAEWTFHVAGRDAVPIEFPRRVRPGIVRNLPWSDYVALVRRTDVGLCLMDAPHASYPLLDFAASGALVVSNLHGIGASFASYSNLIIPAGSSIEGLTRGIAEAAARAADRDRRQADREGHHINRDWEAALAPLLARLYPSQTLG